MKNLFLLPAFLFLSILATGQGVKVSQAPGSPDASSILDVESTSKGFLPPRMTTVQRDAISSPLEGLMIYNTTTRCTETYRGSGLGWYSPCINAPLVTTGSASPVYGLNAGVAGTVVFDGGAAVTSRGICWNTSPAPTTSNFTVSSGSGTGSFTGNLSGLFPSTTYYARAFAVNSVGTSYGSEVSFTTTAGTAVPFLAGTSWTAPASVTVLQLLVVGGGGGGGCDNGGGGGAGGVRYDGAYTVVPGNSYAVVVGNGGAGGPNGSTAGSNGQNSSFSTFVALGGGGGASLSTNTGLNGGSGGGGCRATGSGNGGTGTAGQGNNGGNAISNNFIGAGGGGATANGGNAVSGIAGNGGAGVTYLGYTVGGGGGGGCGNETPGTGGIGGGGNGAVNSNATPGAGAANSGGGGGGGGGYFAAGPGAAGGSGIVVIRY
jgi:hypothetical protein